MSTISYPQTITQTTGGKYATFDSLTNIKNAIENKHAITKLIKSKKTSPNRPSTIDCKNFRLNLPTGAKVTAIKVEYRQRLDPYNSKYPSINAPTISLLNVSGYSKKGIAPNKSMTTRTITFTPKKSTDFSASKLNNTNFGVRINYPTNGNTNSGYLRISFVRITVTYKAPSFTVAWSIPSSVEQNSTVSTTLKVSNKNLTDYVPTLTVTTPAGFTLKNIPTGDGTWNNVGTRTYTWKPKFTSKKGNINLGLDFDVSVSGTLPVSSTFDAVEGLTGATGSKTISVVEKTPESHTDTDSTDAKIVNTKTIEKVQTVTVDEWFTLESVFSDEELIYNTYFISFYKDPAFEKYPTTNYSNSDLAADIFSIDENGQEIVLGTGDTDITDFIVNNSITLPFKCDDVGEYGVVINDEDGTTTFIKKLKLYVRPKESSLTTPSLIILTLSDEEKNRLGDGHVYTAQTDLQEITSETYVRDWYKNFRIGVFNNPISANQTSVTYYDEEGTPHIIEYDSTDYDTLTAAEIVANAEYWSNCPAEVNTTESLECQFKYDKQYPLYILVTGDYPENANPATIQFTEPCIIETDAYNGREKNGNYPIPILNLINHEGDSSNITIPTYENGAPIVIYNLDLDENYGTDTDMAIRGIALQLTIDDYSECVLSCQLKSPTGATGERSVIIEDRMLDEDNVLTVGGIGDLWNFNTLDLVDLNSWEFVLTLQNILTETETHLTISNAEIVFYVEQVTDQKEWCYINGEDIRYYGAFIEDINIPSGLNTTTQNITIDGTDTNEIINQNIREKTITLELEIGDNCDLKTATDGLRQLTQLILNERDAYNRPIPKQIRFSFLPDVYFNYIVEDTFENPIDISSYNIKAKLTVPSGTAYKTNSTTTNTTGNVQGLAKVNPTISLKPTGTNIEVTETISKQKFLITLPETTNQIIVIDTENRTCTLQNDEDSTEKTDITKYVDFNSDWFTLQGTYTFTGTNCYIRSVEYVERW